MQWSHPSVSPGTCTYHVGYVTVPPKSQHLMFRCLHSWRVWSPKPKLRRFVSLLGKASTIVLWVAGRLTPAAAGLPGWFKAGHTGKSQIGDTITGSRPRSGCRETVEFEGLPFIVITLVRPPAVLPNQPPTRRPAASPGVSIALFCRTNLFSKVTTTMCRTGGTLPRWVDR
jgi:hypothetical protein